MQIRLTEWKSHENRWGFPKGLQLTRQQQKMFCIFPFGNSIEIRLIRYNPLLSNIFMLLAIENLEVPGLFRGLIYVKRFPWKKWNYCWHRRMLNEISDKTFYFIFRGIGPPNALEWFQGKFSSGDSFCLPNESA